jgi:low temperature requirement protein LtrA
VLAATVAVQSSLDAGHAAGKLLWLTGAGAVIVFSMWWLYFDTPAHERLTSLRRAFLWGYGHYPVFASAAAVGAGLAVAVDFKTGTAHIPAVGAGYSIAVPVAVFLLSVWALHIRASRTGAVTPAYLITTGLVLVTPLTPAPVELIALLLAALVAVTVLASTPRGTARAISPEPEC